MIQLDTSGNMSYDNIVSRRIQPIITNQIYHVFNRSVAGQPFFYSIKDYQRFLCVVDYYRFLLPDLRFSFYNRLGIKEKENYLLNMKKTKSVQVQIFAYCFMPNHYHFLIKELEANGIRTCTGNLQNSYAKYFNKKNKRSGSLFQEMFKTVRIENDEQFVHLARYIHLNPLTSYLIKHMEDLEAYPYSSFPVYMGRTNNDFVDTTMLLGYYQSRDELKTFTLDQADYQRKIHDLEYLLIEKDENYGGV